MTNNDSNNNEARRAFEVKLHEYQEDKKLN
jgi:hypothetical protein